MKKLECLASKVVTYDQHDFKYGGLDTYKDELEEVKFSELKYQRVDLSKYKYKINPRVSNRLIDKARTRFIYRDEILEAIANKEELEIEWKGDAENLVDRCKFIPISEIKDDIIAAIEEQVELELVENTLYNNLFSKNILVAKGTNLNDYKKSIDLYTIGRAILDYQKASGIDLISIYATKHFSDYSETTSEWIDELGKICFSDNAGRVASDGREEFEQARIRIDKYSKSLLIYNPCFNMGYYTQKNYNHRIQLILGGFKKIETRVVDI